MWKKRETQRDNHFEIVLREEIKTGEECQILNEKKKELTHK